MDLLLLFLMNDLCFWLVSLYKCIFLSLTSWYYLSSIICILMGNVYQSLRAWPVINNTRYCQLLVQMDFSTSLPTTASTYLHVKGAGCSKKSAKSLNLQVWSALFISFFKPFYPGVVVHSCNYIRWDLRWDILCMRSVWNAHWIPVSNNQPNDQQQQQIKNQIRKVLCQRWGNKFWVLAKCIIR